jgi:hypothetical protein
VVRVVSTTIIEYDVIFFAEDSLGDADLLILYKAKFLKKKHREFYTKVLITHI